jgi:hypothetical protein
MLYLNADDFGLSNEVNAAIDKCFKEKIIYRASIMVNMPCVEQAMELARQNLYLHKIGLHLNITQGEPLTSQIKTTGFCTKGVFNKKILRPINMILPLKKRQRSTLEKEIIEQCVYFKKLGGISHHIDSHHHIHTNYNLNMVVVENAIKNEFTSIRLMKNIPENTGVKKIIKMVINNRLMIMNRVENNDVFKFFCDITDVKKINEEDITNKKIEVMVHPIIKNNQLIDAISGIDLISWKKNYNKYIYQEEKK